MKRLRVAVLDRRGLVTSAVGRHLTSAGIDVVPFDLQRPEATSDVDVDIVLLGELVQPLHRSRRSRTRVIRFTDDMTFDGLTAAVLGPGRLPSRATGSTDGQLTARERTVLRWVASGLRADEIAAILGITRASVVNHKQRIFSKLGVQSQAEAVVAARRSGQLTVVGSDGSRGHE
jgi:DNA-binding CsgD family transcriptional regulator